MGEGCLTIACPNKQKVGGWSKQESRSKVANKGREQDFKQRSHYPRDELARLSSKL